MSTALALTCRRCNVALEQDDLRCPICALATTADLAPRPPGATILRCDGCGAAVSYNADAKALKCGFCGALMRLEQPQDPLERAESLLEFRVAPEQADRALRGWMRTLGFFRPNDLASESVIATLQPLFFCAWLVDADSTISWSADSDAGSRRSSWAPHAGQTSLAFRALMVPASRGLLHEECARLAPHYDLRALKPATPQPAGVHVEEFDVQRSMARHRVVEALELTAADRLQRDGVIPGSRYRNVHVAALLRGLHTRRVLFPAYVLAYRYKGKPYRAIVHGMDAGCTFGASPVSWRKVLVLVVAVLLVLGLLAALIAAVR